MTTWYPPEEIQNEAVGQQRPIEFGPATEDRQPWSPGHPLSLVDYEADAEGLEAKEATESLVAGVNRIAAIIAAEITNGPQDIF